MNFYIFKKYQRSNARAKYKLFFLSQNLNLHQSVERRDSISSVLDLRFIDTHKLFVKIRFRTDSDKKYLMKQ
jgi:hypothetical protein